jgi:long-chain fatty acid transport protein
VIDAAAETSVGPRPRILRREAKAARALSRTCFFLLAWLSPQSAHGGGILAQEVANPRNGVAQAGAAAYAYDAATAFYNPAGMSRLDEPALMIGLQPILTDIEFETDVGTTISGGSGGDQGGFAPSLMMAYVRPLNDRWALGVATAGLGGGALDPDGDWAGRFSVTELSFVAVTVNPTVSYRVNDWFSVGFGAGVNYGRLDFELSLPRLTPGAEGEIEMDGVDDLELNFNVGILLEWSERTRFGISYRSEVDFELSGDFNLINPTPALLLLGVSDGDVDADIPIPQFLRVSAFHQLTDSLAVMANVGWEDWSIMDFTPLTGPAGREVQVPREWRDTWHFAFGVEWQAEEHWLLQAGLAYDTSAARSRETNFADMPTDRQWRFSVGFVYSGKAWGDIGFNYTFVDFGSAPINASSTFGTLEGEYEDFNAHVVALSFSF